MAHTLVWPGRYFLYAVGNTSAVCLTRDLPPEESADILLLGCGDPRNVLYTIYSEPSNATRRLDFTCCDFDPAILARNILLFTLIVDEKPHMTILWNIFFHVYLDESSNDALKDQCRKLISISDSIQTWNASTYASSIRVCTEHTLVEVRRHWQLYLDFSDLPRSRKDKVREAFRERSKKTLKEFHTNFSSARSSGPLMFEAATVVSEQFRKWWKHGSVFTSEQELATYTHFNPTFAYSLAGEGFNVHYATDPLIPFHMASVFANAKSHASATDIGKAAKACFSDWCSAFHSMLSSLRDRTPMVRFMYGEATATCRVLHLFATSGTLKSNIPVAQWKTQLLHLSEAEYARGGAPATFTVIETSNLVDHLGLLNIIIAAVPLISRATSASVLYTESLLFLGEDATKEFTELLHANIATLSLLLGICPVDYLSGFTTRSNLHELFLHQLGKKDKKESVGHTQFHQVTTWKSPASGDANVVQGGIASVVLDSCQLGTFLYDMYHQIFEQEDAMHFWRLNQGNMLRAIGSSNIIHYTRESFVLLLKLVRDRLSIPGERWMQVMDRFMELVQEDQTLPMDTVNRQDLLGHLQRQGVYMMSYLRDMPRKIGIFSKWDVVTPLVRIILTIPREKLNVLEEALDRVGTPVLQCDLRGKWSHNAFSSVHVAYGRAILMGNKARPYATFEQDPQGRDGDSPLVASFTVSTQFLTDIEPMENLWVFMSVRSTPGTAVLVPKLGLEMVLFRARLLDESSVFVLPENPLPVPKPLSVPGPRPASNLMTEIGEPDPVVVELDEQCDLVAHLISRTSIRNDAVKDIFRGGATPTIAQIAPCTMRITVGRHSQDIIYPFPIQGSENKLRLARKSLWIEIVVPPSGSFKADGMRVNPFPVVPTEASLNPWSIHRVNLSRLPTLDTRAKKIDLWLNPHVGAMMSTRERSMRKKQKEDTLMHIKDSLHCIFVRSTGIQGGSPSRMFALRDEASNNCDTILFVSEVRFDLHSHTLIWDGYVLPLTRDLLARMEKPFVKLVDGLTNVGTKPGEMKAWKQLIPAFVERCRSSWTHGINCEYKSQGRIPLTENMEVDPLCSCGRGKDTEGMTKVALWKPFAPYVTRIALSPLFAVSYLETVGRDPTLHKCFVCRGKGKPKLQACTGCMKIRYCSRECQKKHWKVHKSKCNKA